MDDVSTLQQEWLQGARDSVRERPMTYLAAALVAGMVISRWMR